ncbi:unnamed protein product [Angiostrongylus costaricensis]|uniref:Uncharacterized protein n=1 Tax=Angiostrongylus costaricensis TaxID=334426 RepID=A0A0R3PQU2_ANGCS|nr:unnamed protein product [Angiostrongylus costaricensis]
MRSSASPHRSALPSCHSAGRGVCKSSGCRRPPSDAVATVACRSFTSYQCVSQATWSSLALSRLACSSSPIAHCPLPVVCRSPRIAHRSPHTAHRSPRIAHRSPRIAHRSPHTAHHSLPAAHRSPLVVCRPLPPIVRRPPLSVCRPSLVARRSPPAAHRSPLVVRCSSFAARP